MSYMFFKEIVKDIALCICYFHVTIVGTLRRREHLVVKMKRKCKWMKTNGKHSLKINSTCSYNKELI
jgi:hypothetical protein